MENEIVKTSIFLQRTFKRRYVPYVYKSSSGWISYMEEAVSATEEEICRCNIALPLLERGEMFYIEEIEKMVKINGRHRTSKDLVVYDLEPKVIDDEETIETYEALFVKLEDTVRKIVDENQEQIKKAGIVDRLMNTNSKFKRLFGEQFKLNKTDI